MLTKNKQPLKIPLIHTIRIMVLQDLQESLDERLRLKWILEYIGTLVTNEEKFGE